MFRYAYDNCPVCGLIFTDNDDVVVCPTCGTPHHRECYKNSGGCANESKHAEGFIFESATMVHEDRKQDDNPLNSDFNASSDTDHSENASQENNPFESDTFNSPFGHVITDGEKIDEVPVGDLKKFIGPAWIYYIPLFYAKIKGLRIFRINFSAFIGSYIWLLSRKIYGLGIVFSLLTFASYLYIDFYEAYAVFTKVDLSIEAILTSDDPMILIGYYAYALASNIPIVLSVITGIFANKIYMKKCIKRVKKINHSSKTAEQFNKRLVKKGSVSMPLFFLAIALYISYFILAQRGIIGSLMTELITILF